MNSTSFFYAHTDQWRYEKLGMEEVLSPLADKKQVYQRQHDRLQRARRAHGLAAQRAAAADQPAAGGEGRRSAGMDPKDYAVKGTQGRHAQDELHRPGPPGQLAAQHVRVALQHPGLVGKGHEYFLKHLLGTSNGVQGKDLGKDEAKPPRSSGTTRRPKASWTCWSRWTSA
jgi:nitrate reductase alpha subunit